MTGQFVAAQRELPGELPLKNGITDGSRRFRCGMEQKLNGTVPYADCFWHASHTSLETIGFGVMTDGRSLRSV